MINRLLMILITIHAGCSIKRGALTDPRKFNYVVSIQKFDHHYCSGVIINENHIITVAHRIANLNIEDLRVVIGMIGVIGGWADQYSVKEMFLHPGFQERHFVELLDDKYYEHDIAVLRLEGNLTWASYALFMETQYIWSCHSNCILISWSLPDDGGRPMFLNSAFIQLMNNGSHEQWAIYLGKYQNLFGDFFKIVDISEEDVGSPIVCGNNVVGLVVKGQRLTIPEKPSIMMSIAPYLPFIDGIVHDGLLRIKPGEFPYIAALWYNDIYTCGGFIVDAIHVATAGHCVINAKITDFTVSVGYPPQFFSLSNIAIHPNYKLEITNVPFNWYIDHDFALLTLTKPIMWNQATSPLPLIESDYFHAGQICQLLRWKYHKEITGEEFIKLMISQVIILNNECSQSHLDPTPESQVPSFWGRSEYLTAIADHKDAGNPIICNGNPVGFLIQTISAEGKSTAVIARFLKIRPYIESRNSSLLRIILSQRTNESSVLSAQENDSPIIKLISL